MTRVELFFQSLHTGEETTVMWVLLKRICQERIVEKKQGSLGGDSVTIRKIMMC